MVAHNLLMVSSLMLAMVSPPAYGLLSLDQPYVWHA
jgi:hypothetical protein